VHEFSKDLKIHTLFDCMNFSSFETPQQLFIQNKQKT